MSQTYLISQREVPAQEILDWVNRYHYYNNAKEVTPEIIEIFKNSCGMTCRDPFLLVEIRHDFSNDYGSSCSVTFETTLDVKDIEEGKKLAEVLSKSRDIKPLRLMFPNFVIERYE